MSGRLSLVVGLGARNLVHFSSRVQTVDYETTKRGFSYLTAFIPMLNDEARYWHNNLMLADVKLTNGVTIAFHGRIEDMRVLSNGFEFTAYGYWRAYKDNLYSALWSTERYLDWTTMTDEDGAAYKPAKWNVDTSYRLYASPKKDMDFGAATDRAGIYLEIPNGSARNFKEIRFDYDVSLRTNWKAELYSGDSLPCSTLEWSVTTSGSGSNQVETLSTARKYIELRVHNQTGGIDTTTEDDGDSYAVLTNVRVLTTEGDASGELHADEIAIALVNYIDSINPDQVSDDTTLIEDPGVDIMTAVYEDRWPADILSELAELGDSSTPPGRVEMGVWEDKKLFLRGASFRGGGGQFQETWKLDILDTLQYQTSLSNVYNQTYAAYRDEDGITRRTTATDDEAAQAELGIVRTAVVKPQTTDATEAGTWSDTYLEYYKVPKPSSTFKVANAYSRDNASVPLYAIRANDIAIIRNLTPNYSGSVSELLREQEIIRTNLDVIGNLLTIIPGSEPPMFPRIEFTPELARQKYVQHEQYLRSPAYRDYLYSEGYKLGIFTPDTPKNMTIEQLIHFLERGGWHGEQ